MSGKAITITGLGAVSAAGTGCAATLAGLREGRHRAACAAGVATALAKPVFEVCEALPGDAADDMRTLRLAFCAAEEALADAGDPQQTPGLRVGVCLGTSVACQLNDVAFYREFRSTGRGPMAAVERYARSNLASALARRMGLKGPAATVANACSSGTDAVGLALSWLRQGWCDAVLAGGADELNPVPLAGFHALGVMSDGPCRPFDRDRSGLNLGEGAGLLLLETAESAARRGLAPGLRCEGYGTCGDAHHLTAPRADGSGLEAAIRIALEQAGIAVGAVGFVNAHGTATPTNDLVEGAVLARLFGPDCMVSATKGYTGHALGAAGGLEAVFTALALREGWLPASAGFETADPAIPLEPVRRETPVACRHALSTSLAFGGNNSALVLGWLP